jgi:hypothetical protein
VHIDQQVIDLATGIQRRRDFTAHTTGFAASAVVVGSLTLAGVRGGRLYAATLLTWATALPITDGSLLCQRGSCSRADQPHLYGRECLPAASPKHAKRRECARSLRPLLSLSVLLS